MYFSCKNQQTCLKKAYIKYDSGNLNKIELFLSTNPHNHIQKRIHWETKEKIMNLFNKNDLTFKEIMKILEKKNLEKISFIQFMNLRSRYKSKTQNF